MHFSSSLDVFWVLCGAPEMILSSGNPGIGPFTTWQIIAV
jgi:hypothetical protein